MEQVSTSLCGRDGRTICGPLCVPKSTYVTLAHKRKQKFFFYFGCSLVRRFYCKKANKNNNGTDGQTDRQTDRVRRNMRPPPREEGRIIRDSINHSINFQICGHPSNSPDLINPMTANLWHNSATSLPDIGTGCERFDAASDCVSAVQESVIDACH